jgi:hypothetical protein
MSDINLNKIISDSQDAENINEPVFLNISTWVPEYIENNWLIPNLESNNNILCGVRYLWNIYFTNFVTVSEDTWTESSVMNSSEGITNQAFWTTTFQKDLKSWYEQLSPDNQGKFTTADSTTDKFWYQTDPIELATSWSTQLYNESVKQRTFSSFTFVFEKLLIMLDSLNTITVQQSERMSSITSGETNAVDAMSNVVQLFTDPTEASDARGSTINQQYQTWLQVYQGYQAFASSKTSQENNLLTQSNQSLQDQQTVMSGLIQQMEAILNNLFR